MHLGHNLPDVGVRRDRVSGGLCGPLWSHVFLPIGTRSVLFGSNCTHRTTRPFTLALLYFLTGLRNIKRTHVSSMSHSSPSIQRIADSFPFTIPHSKSSQGPRFSMPYCFSTRRIAARIMFKVSGVMVSR